MRRYSEKMERNKIRRCARGRGLAAVSLSSLEVFQPSYCFFVFWQNLLSLHTPSAHPSFLTRIAPTSASPPPNPPELPLPPACLLTQTLNLLEPRDPVCYVKWFSADTHMGAHTPQCTHRLMQAAVQFCRHACARAHS